jgi:hypothetical protein
MDFNIVKENLNKIGLIFNLIGVIAMYFSTGEDSNEWIHGEKGMKPGEKWHPMIIKRPYRLKVGIVFVCVGLFFSFIYLLY